MYCLNQQMYCLNQDCVMHNQRQPVRLFLREGYWSSGRFCGECGMRTNKKEELICAKCLESQPRGERMKKFCVEMCEPPFVQFEYKENENRSNQGFKNTLKTSDQDELEVIKP